MMAAIHSALMALHVAAGAVALFSMWIPLLAKKGGPRHRRAGKIFVAAMAVLCASAFGASSMRLALQPSQLEQPLFLMLVGLLAGVTTFMGKRVLAQKGRTASHRGIVEYLAAGALTVAGVVAAGFGVAGPGDILFIIFGALSIWVGAGFLLMLRSAPKSRWFWWYEHLGAMSVACISTVTAFLVVNYHYAPQGLRDLVPPVVVWVLPGVLGGAGISLATARYKRQLG